jgi:hypothetical protein
MATKAEVSALIAAARTSVDDLVTWAEMVGILNSILALPMLVDLGTPVEDKVAKVIGGVWAQGTDAGGTGGTGNNSGTITIP